jgi:hypothetical protein
MAILAIAELNTPVTVRMTAEANAEVQTATSRSLTDE